MLKVESALYLFPVTLGETTYEKVLPLENREILCKIKHFVVESRRSAIRFIRLASPSIDIDSLDFVELSEHTDLKSIGHFLDPLLKDGLPIGIISDAGCPSVADPGSSLVSLAHQKGLRVIPLSGPSSIILSLMASGFNGQNFAFNGYLPVKPAARSSKIRQLENRAWNEDQTQIFIEAPYRNIKMLESILSTCRKETLLCVASGITTQDEYIKTLPIAKWKSENPPIDKVPTIFLIYRGLK